MTRDIDLVSYLPPFLAEFKEIAVTLEAENPEFMLVWKAVERVLYNEFIETADEYGISRFERLLNIIPSNEDTLEGRRKRALFLWNFKYPYTMSYLKEKLAEICGNDYSISVKDYRIDIITHLFKYGDMESVRNMLIKTIPCNMEWEITNDLTVSKLDNYYSGCNMLHSVITIGAES